MIGQAAMILCLAAAAGAVTILETYDAPDENLGGLAFLDGSLYAVDSLSGQVYRIDPATGEVESQWSTACLPNTATGMGATPGTLWIGFTNGMVRRYGEDGTVLGTVDAVC